MFHNSVLHFKPSKSYFLPVFKRGGKMADFKNGSILLKSLYEESLSGTGTDLIFRVGPDLEIVKAHALIVTQASPAFKSMLNGCWDLKRNDGGQAVQELPVDDPKVFKTLIKLMYGFSGYTSNDFKELLPVYQMADKYQATEVQKVLSDYSASMASTQLTVANVVEIYLSAKECGIQVLQTAAQEYIFRNIKSLWESDTWLDLDEEALAYVLAQDDLCGLDLKSIKLKCIGNCCRPRCNNSNCAKTNYGSQNEQLIFGKVLQWIEHQKEKNTEDQGCVSRILSQIRICQLTYIDYIKAMKDAKQVLTEEEMGQLLIARLASTHDGTYMKPFQNSTGFRMLKLVDTEVQIPVGTCTMSDSEPQPFVELDGFYVCQNAHGTKQNNGAGSQYYHYFGGPGDDVIMACSRWPINNSLS